MRVTVYGEEYRDKAGSATSEWAALRLRDRIRHGVRVLFVGINPGVRSATVGHHFAGPSNRFWKLLYESGLVDEPIGYLEDDRLSGVGLRDHQPGGAADARH